MANRILGDGLVPVASALGIETAHQWVAHGVGHLELLDHPAVAAKVLHFLGDPWR